MAQSLQDIIKRRQREDFGGREDQLPLFRRNLGWEVDDPRRRFVINVFGQGGMGKTWLLRRFRQIANDFLALFPDHTPAQAMRHLLQQHLQEVEK